MNISWVGSPNYDPGRAGTKIDRIVIHWMDGTLASTDAVFQDGTRRTSAHYGVEDGNIHQYVKEADTAFHAGNYPMNQRSIGIEHSAAPGRPASDLTLQSSAKLIADIISRNPGITLNRVHIIRHGEVIPTDCCGTVDPDKLIALAKGGGMDPALQDAMRYKNKFIADVGAVPIEATKVITVKALEDLQGWKKTGQALQAVSGIDVPTLVALLKSVESKLS